jgi:translation initiation factor 4A
MSDMNNKNNKNNKIGEDIPETNEYQYDIFEQFDQMGLDEDILGGIYAMGFERPSAIQKKAIVPIKEGRDIIAQSQSGTGKTATFTIGVLSRINRNEKTNQAIILGPTRELAKQIYDVFIELSKNMGIKVKLLIGGNSRSKYDTEHSVDDQILVGTPGRISEYLNKKKINASTLKIIILDEADEMLSRGFQDQIQKIFYDIPVETQVGLFSATMPGEMLELTNKFMRNPVKFLVHNDELTLEGIRQYYVYINDEVGKYEVLSDLFGAISINQSMIYVNSRKKANMLVERMQAENFTVACINGSMLQEERNEVMKEFRAGTKRVLITTDILSRGIDVQQVSLVINYELPLEKETYIHRIGRSGRFGRKGVAINLVGPWEFNDLKKLEKFYNTEIQELPANVNDVLTNMSS